MGRDLGIVRFGHAGDLLRFENAADAPQRHLQDRRCFTFQHTGKFIFSGQPFTGGNRNGGLLGDDGHLFRHFGGRWLLEPERVVGFQPFGQADGAGWGQLAVGAEEQIAFAPHRFPDQADKFLTQIQRFQRELARVKGGVGADGVKFNGGKALLRILGRPFRRKFGVMIDIGLVIGFGVNVGVGAQLFMHLAAQQLIDRLVQFLAHNVPTGHFNPTKNAQDGSVGALGVAAAVDVAPELLDLERVVTDHLAGAEVLNHLGDDMGMKRHRIDFAVADNITIGDQLEKDPVPASKVGRRIADDKGFDIDDFHKRLARSGAWHWSRSLGRTYRLLTHAAHLRLCYYKVRLVFDNGMNRHYTLFHLMEQVYSMAQIVSDKREHLSSLQLVERVFAVLRVIGATTEGAGVTQIAQQTGLPKSTVSRICATLEQLALVTRLSGKEAGGRGFKIGTALVALVANVPRTESLATIAQPYLQRLQEAIGETVALTLPEGDNAYVVTQITSHQAIQVRDWTGVRIPMYLQSTGRIFLAERADEALDRYLAQPLLPYTSKTICDPTQLRQILAQVREQGYAWVAEEFEEGLTALAAPVRNATGQVIAAVNVFGPTFRFPAAGRQAEITLLTLQAAHLIGAQQHKLS